MLSNFLLIELIGILGLNSLSMIVDFIFKELRDTCLEGDSSYSMIICAICFYFNLLTLTQLYKHYCLSLILSTKLK